MPVLADDLRYLIDRNHRTARPPLHDLVARMPNSVEARRLLGESYQRGAKASWRSLANKRQPETTT